MTSQDFIQPAEGFIQVIDYRGRSMPAVRISEEDWAYAMEIGERRSDYNVAAGRKRFNGLPPKVANQGGLMAEAAVQGWLTQEGIPWQSGPDFTTEYARIRQDIIVGDLRIGVKHFPIITLDDVEGKPKLYAAKQADGMDKVKILPYPDFAMFVATKRDSRMNWLFGWIRMGELKKCPTEIWHNQPCHHIKNSQLYEAQALLPILREHLELRKQVMGTAKQQGGLFRENG